MGSRKMGANGSTDFHPENASDSFQHQFLDSESPQHVDQTRINEEFQGRQHEGTQDDQTLPMEQEVLAPEIEEGSKEVLSESSALPRVPSPGTPTRSRG